MEEQDGKRAEPEAEESVIDCLASEAPTQKGRPPVGRAAKLSEIALHHPVFKELVREEREIIMPINEHRAYVLRTTNRLLGRIPGVQGVKTGFTSKAGRCLIAKVSQDGSDLLLVILNSKRRWNTATSLINYGLRLSDSRAALVR